MERKHLHIDGHVISEGVRKASSRSEEPILCLIRHGTIQFVALSGLRLVTSWTTQLRRQVSRSLAFLIPPIIANLLSSDIIRSQVGVDISLRGDDVVLRMIDHLGSYEIRWKSDLASFPAPPEFSELIRVPQTLVDVPYIRISDAAHRAVAKLAHLESETRVDPAKLAILIALDFGRLSLNGTEILATRGSQYYFDPRLVIRALEFVKDRTVRVGITPLVRSSQRAYLSLYARQDGWVAHCALLSIGKETQKLYPIPSGRNR